MSIFLNREVSLGGFQRAWLPEGTCLAQNPLPQPAPSFFWDPWSPQTLEEPSLHVSIDVGFYMGAGPSSAWCTSHTATLRRLRVDPRLPFCSENSIQDYWLN